MKSTEYVKMHVLTGNCGIVYCHKLLSYSNLLFACYYQYQKATAASSVSFAVNITCAACRANAGSSLPYRSSSIISSSAAAAGVAPNRANVTTPPDVHWSTGRVFKRIVEDIRGFNCPLSSETSDRETVPRMLCNLSVVFVD